MPVSPLDNDDKIRTEPKTVKLMSRIECGDISQNAKATNIECADE